ncbi:hypothetical protein MMC27_001673 [Xylographa pallens]|nr:hypothetical protein [Xylographa pallens]
MANRSFDGVIHRLPAERNTSPRPSFTDSISPFRLFRASIHAAERALFVKASLFGLPLEIRLLIYEYLFWDDVDQFPTIINLRRGDQLSEWVKDMDLRFCDVFTGTYHEALPVAFGCSSFRLDGFVRSGECSYRSGKKNPGENPEDTRILQSLIDHIRTVHVDLKWLIHTRYRVQWHRVVPTPRLLRTVIVQLPHEEQPGVFRRIVLESPHLCADIGAAVQVLLQRGLKVDFECGGLTDLELLAWGEAFSQPDPTQIHKHYQDFMSSIWNHTALP